MIQSMTGYGKAEYVYADHKTIVEIKSLNSKQLDLNLKAATLFRDKEAEIRQILTPLLERGKVDVSIYTQALSETPMEGFTPLNKEAFRYYYNELSALMDEVGGDKKDIVGAILRLPDVVKTPQAEAAIPEEEWERLQHTIAEAVKAFQAFRIQEGAALEKMFTEKLNGIADLLGQVEPYEKGRVEKIKQHLLQNLNKLAAETQQQVDHNRLEAELIYYLEKLDITEEKVRLSNHIRYFRETMTQTGNGVGKKLGFVAQEMGREINTLGSKSNQSEMQILVVKMKDILEQIKEQVLNVL